METVTGNVQLYEEHQPTVDALAQESLRLREELLAFAKAYEKMKVSDPEGELLKIFARDIHAAHQEFLSRLSFLADNEVRSKADDAAQANAENERLRIELEQTKKQLQVKEDELRASLSREEKLSTQISTNDTFRKALRNHYKNVCNKELWEMKGFLVILRKFCEWYDGDCAVITTKLDELEQRIQGIAKHRKEIYQHLGSLQWHADTWNGLLGRSHHQEVTQEKGHVHACTNRLGEEEHLLEELKKGILLKKKKISEKNEQFDNLVKEGSELSNLLEFLQNNL